MGLLLGGDVSDTEDDPAAAVSAAPVSTPAPTAEVPAEPSRQSSHKSNQQQSSAFDGFYQSEEATLLTPGASSAFLMVLPQRRLPRPEASVSPDGESGGLAGVHRHLQQQRPGFFSFDTPSPDDIAQYRLRLQRMHGSNDADNLKDEGQFLSGCRCANHSHLMLIRNGP